MERLDVVDENDEVVGSATREEAHAQRLLHRSVHVFLFNRAGELFLQRRAERLERYPGLWTSSASGHVDAGEDYESAAARELTEEIGVCADLWALARFRFEDEVENEWSTLFETHFDGELRLDPEAVMEGRFVPLPTLRAWIAKDRGAFAPSFLVAIASYEAKRSARKPE